MSDHEDWRVVNDEGLVLAEGRRLLRRVGWYGWTLGPGWAGNAVVGALSAGEAARSMASWHAIHRSATAPFVLMSDMSLINMPDENMADAMTISNAAMQEISRSMSPWCQAYVVVMPRAWTTNWWGGMLAAHASAVRATLCSSREEAWDVVQAPAHLRTTIESLHTRELLDNGLTLLIENALRDDARRGLADVASVVGVSVRSLQRTLKHQGDTFVGLRNRIRMELAERHLGTGMQVKSVATLVGFGSTSHFVAWYRGHNGSTPGGRRQSQ